MTYLLCERTIKNKRYESVEEMTEKLEAFVLNNRISPSQKEQLIELLKEIEG
ncbi:hypothetical protein AAHH17_16375 [Lysinibacillus capsici]|uniref:hypothetical protein n=1 Tax=Lysinibacillus capsici TaxID=2115968 RepID=UPI0032E381FD